LEYKKGVKNKKMKQKGGDIKMEEETTDEIVVRFSNVGHRQKLDRKKLLGVGREHCVRDYSCCGHVP